MSIKFNIYLSYWYFQQNQCLNINKHVIHNIHRLTWDTYGNRVPSAKTALMSSMPHRYHDIKARIYIEIVLSLGDMDTQLSVVENKMINTKSNNSQKSGK